jgi:hypothetical protein
MLIHEFIFEIYRIERQTALLRNTTHKLGTCLRERINVYTQKNYNKCLTLSLLEWKNANFLRKERDYDLDSHNSLGNRTALQCENEMRIKRSKNEKCRAYYWNKFKVHTCFIFIFFQEANISIMQ